MNAFDIIGPVMIGPSSSHTAGAVRIGRIAGALLGTPAVRARIDLFGSFARTYKGHGTDRALVAGILGMAPDDERIRDSFACAQRAGLQFEMIPRFDDNADLHPNTAAITLWDAAGRQVEIVGASVGGGNILVTRFNGMDVCVTGRGATFIVLHRDEPGAIAAVTELLSAGGANISNFRLSREQKGGRAVMTIEIDGKPDTGICGRLMDLPGILNATLIEPN